RSRARLALPLLSVHPPRPPRPTLFPYPTLFRSSPPLSAVPPDASSRARSSRTGSRPSPSSPPPTPTGSTPTCEHPAYTDPLTGPRILGALLISQVAGQLGLQTPLERGLDQRGYEPAVTGQLDLPGVDLLEEGVKLPRGIQLFDQVLAR